jgi:hypothetical protein
VAAAAALEWQLLGYAAVLVVEAGVLFGLLPHREPARPRLRSPSGPLLVLAALGVVPWLVHAERIFRANRRDAGVIMGDVTTGVDHYAVQGALALALVALSLLAAWWPCLVWGSAWPSSGPSLPGQSRASSAARSSRPREPCDRAVMCHAFRSKSAPRARRAASRPSNQARSPSL